MKIVKTSDTTYDFLTNREETLSLIIDLALTLKGDGEFHRILPDRIIEFDIYKNLPHMKIDENKIKLSETEAIGIIASLADALNNNCNGFEVGDNKCAIYFKVDT